MQFTAKPRTCGSRKTLLRPRQGTNRLRGPTSDSAIRSKAMVGVRFATADAVGSAGP
jgi:hypothetical protein